MDYLQTGIARGLIKINEDNSRITYIYQNKTYNYKNPEEKVRAESYVQLVSDYGYAPKRIAVEREVQMGVAKKSADLIVFDDDARTAPYIVVECKKEEASDSEYNLGIDEGFSYAVALRASFLWVTSKILDSYYDVSSHPALERDKNQIADIPRFGKTELSRAKFYKGGIDENGDKAFDIEEIPQSELTRRFKQAHDALWAGGKRDPSEAFDELDKVIFCKIWDEKFDRKRGTPYDFQLFAKEKPEELYKRLHSIYVEGRKYDPQVFQDDIRLTPTELETVVGYLASVNLSETDLDSKGKAFEIFMDSFFRGEFGQYFTPRPIVDFIVDVLPIENKDFVLDPSCGSSGFLLHVLNKIRKQADEFYDAEKQPVKHKGFWHDFAKDNLYGIEISDKISRVAKMNMILHDDGHTNVLAHDGLEPIEKISNYAREKQSRGHFNFKPEQFEFITTNPPFGSVIKAAQKRYIADYELGRKNFDWIDAKLNNLAFDASRDSQKSEILFLEQCYKFLKPNGFLAVVLPDGILTNSSLQYVRDWIEEHFRIVAVVSLPQTAFASRGAGVKSSVLFARKYEERETFAIRSLKQNIQEDLFGEARYKNEFARLFAEKAEAIKRGDALVQRINETLVNHIEALRAQETLTGAEQKQLIRQAQEEIKEYQKTEVYKTWKQETGERYNEQIEAVREALTDEYLETVRKKAANYPIFMAIAEEIGYDATGRETRRNELTEIGAQLKEFIRAVVENKDSFFGSALI